MGKVIEKIGKENIKTTMEELLFATIGRLYVQAQNMQNQIISLDKDVKLKNALIQDLQSSVSANVVQAPNLNVGNTQQDNVQVSAGQG